MTAHHLPEGLHTIRSMPMRGFGRVKSSGSCVGSAQGRVGDSTVRTAQYSLRSVRLPTPASERKELGVPKRLSTKQSPRTGKDSASSSLFHPLRRFSPNRLRTPSAYQRI